MVREVNRGPWTQGCKDRVEPVEPGVLGLCGACGPRVLRLYGACGPRGAKTVWSLWTQGCQDSVEPVDPGVQRPLTERTAAHLRDFGVRELSNERSGRAELKELQGAEDMGNNGSAEAEEARRKAEAERWRAEQEKNKAQQDLERIRKEKQELENEKKR
ncbi:hypothetical protein JZ751_010826, partial [Albula glossodonta]